MPSNPLITLALKTEKKLNKNIASYMAMTKQKMLSLIHRMRVVVPLDSGVSTFRANCRREARGRRTIDDRSGGIYSALAILSVGYSSNYIVQEQIYCMYTAPTSICNTYSTYIHVVRKLKVLA